MRNLRNIGIVAHVDAGKTSVTERMLYYTGKIHRIGEVHHGNTTMDSMSQERERGITIQSAATSIYWRDHQINLIDTPGHIDFTVEVERSLRVLDGIVLVLDAVAGVQPQTETVWRQARRYNIPALVFVNKMDRMGANYEYAVQTVENKLGANALRLTVPLGSESELIGVLDVLTGLAWSYPNDGASPQEIHGDFSLELKMARESLMEALANADEQFANLYLGYLDGEAVPNSKAMKAASERAIKGNAAVGVLCGSALKNTGVQTLLDAVIDYLPAPQVKEATARLLVFKVVVQNGSRTTWARIYDGKFSPGDTLYNLRDMSKERVSRILRLNADKVETLSEALPGDIVALVGCKGAQTADTLALDKTASALAPIVLPLPNMSISIEGKDRDHQEKMVSRLQNMVIEDPSLQFGTDQNTGQLLLWGMGELHLEVAISRIQEDGINVTTGRPSVAYRWRLAKPALNVESKVKRQTGGKGSFAVCVFDFMPAEDGVKLENNTVGQAVPKEFAKAALEGVKERAQVGFDGYPVLDFTASLKDGKTHAVDSSEYSFKEAGVQAMEIAMEGNLQRLEPIFDLEIIAPEGDLGQVLGDVQKRRGLVTHTDHQGEEAVVYAKVPLAELFGYTNALRSITQGRGSASMTPAGYEVAPSMTLA